MSATLSGQSGWSFGSKKTLLRTSRDRVLRQKKDLDDLKHVEESEFVRRAKAEAKRKKRQKEQRFFLIMMAAVVLLLALAAQLTYDKVLSHLPEFRFNGMGMGHNQIEQSSFQLAGVSPGMTPSQVKKRHDDVNLSISESGITVTSFKFRDADVTTWHLGQGDGQMAYRIRSTQTFEAGQEETVLQALGQKFGRPATDSCTSSDVGGDKNCRYGWRAESIDLKARTRVTASGRLELTLLAEDVRIRSLLEKR